MIVKGIRATALLLATCISTSSATATCYFPDGSIASNNVPCSSDTYSACCGKSDVCLSNNLCMDTGEQPYVLSRGACTDPNWESDNCPSVCQDINKDGGCSIINLLYKNGVSTYCCGTPISNGSEVICPYGNSFEVATGKMLFGYAALANSTADTSSGNNTCASSNSSSAVASPSASSSSSSSSTPSSSRDTAIGVGVGVPLGVIAGASLVWAVWERRERKRMQRPSGGGNMAMEQGYSEALVKTQRPPVELEVNGTRHELLS
ncbi:hypothetical protein CBS11350_8691 [Aspergillus niger]|nr:hypothetical protein CBS11350_8691 [Aspergillus niger]